MNNVSLDSSKSYKDGVLPPDILEIILPYLSPQDIKNLSITNKYYNTLLDYKDSTTLWHELFHKSYSAFLTNEEPYKNKSTENYSTCEENIISKQYPVESWHTLYDKRCQNTALYTWGCMKHARLGYTMASNDNLTDEAMNGTVSRFKYGVNKPTKVPWFPLTEGKINDRDILHICGGGFSFQILTRSGKIFSTGATFTGGHRGPGPKEGETDYNPFRDAIRMVQNSYPRIFVGNSTAFSIPISTTGTHHGPTPTSNQITAGPGQNNVIPRPHRDIYKEVEELEEKANQQVPGNKHISRMFTRDSFPIYNGVDHDFSIDEEKYGKLKFIALTSGRSHFLALTSEHELYSWDNNESNHGIKIKFDGLPPREDHPILKIASGWNFNCVHMYKVGLVCWQDRFALKKGDMVANANYSVVPGTDAVSGKRRIVDFTCVEDRAIYYIDNEGQNLWKYDNGIVSQILLPTIPDKLLKCISCYCSLVVFTKDKCYSIDMHNGKLSLQTLKQLLLDDPNDHIISLSAGDYHTMALTESGHIYSWGVESQFSGCLGLGRPEYVVENQLGSWDGARNVKVIKPTRIPLPEGMFCISIAAGGWQSAALLMSK